MGAKRLIWTVIFFSIVFILAYVAGDHPSGFNTTVELVRGADNATLKIEVDAIMTDIVRQTLTNQVIDSVLHVEDDLVRSKKPNVFTDYQSQWTTIMVELDYK